jgi:hypothetical protein
VRGRLPAFALRSRAALIYPRGRVTEAFCDKGSRTAEATKGRASFVGLSSLGLAALTTDFPRAAGCPTVSGTVRALTFLLLLASAACGQTNVSKLLEQGMKDAVVTLTPVSAAEKTEVLTAAATLLAKHVTFRPDGTASSTYYGKSQWPVEWRKLVVRTIAKQAVSDADQLNGVTRRYHALLACDACRDWKPDTTAWSEWGQTGFLYFPSAIIVEEKNGVLTARGNDKLPSFSPGPGPSIMDKQAPGTKSDGLPPGMTRMK